MEDGDRSVSKKCTPLGATTIMCYVYENEMKFGQAGMGLKSLVSKKCNGVVFSLVQVFLNSQELTEMNALRRNETFETNATIVHVYSGIISEPSEVRSSDPGSVL